MEPLANPALPVPLPLPLSDPVRRYRWIFAIALPPAVVLMGVDILLPRIGAWTPPDKLVSVLLAATLTGLFCTLCLLPRRATNAIYLRSFRNDAATVGLRTVAQEALGRAFRLSGIRDPRRQWPPLLRQFFYFVFLIRYAQPKFMNLEAGRHWKAQLWRSLGDARCALIDVTELTPFVREEIELATRCLGFHRVLFIGDESRPADQWRQAILTALGMPDVRPECIQIATWADTAAGRAVFRDQVRAFAGGVPAEAPGPNAAAFPESAWSADPDGNAVAGESWRAFWLATLIGMGFSGALMWATNDLPSARLVWYLPWIIFNTLTFLLLAQYFAVCGSRRIRLRLGASFLFAGAFGSLLVRTSFLPPTEGLRGAVARTRSENNLGQIADATHAYHNRPASRTETEEMVVGTWVPSDVKREVAPFINMTLKADGTCNVMTDGSGTYADATYQVTDERIVISRKLPELRGVFIDHELKLVSVGETELVIQWARRSVWVRVHYTRAK